jgi:hypothetical protein
MSNFLDKSIEILYISMGHREDAMGLLPEGDAVI